ncbi:MAG: hypothetical protein ACI88C_003157 [Acidimicrobiales bacterium]
MPWKIHTISGDVDRFSVIADSRALHEKPQTASAVEVELAGARRAETEVGRQRLGVDMTQIRIGFA